MRDIMAKSLWSVFRDDDTFLSGLISITIREKKTDEKNEQKYVYAGKESFVEIHWRSSTYFLLFANAFTRAPIW